MEVKDINYMVSVIVPFYNEELFLAETIESVLNQQYKNLELVLIDDGSSNNSTAIAKKYAQKYTGKVQYVEHENHANKGVGATRNLGLSLARGEFVAFLDADDVWLPNNLSVQVRILNDHPDVAMVCDGYLMWYSWNDRYHKDVVIQVASEQDKVYNERELLFDLYPLGKNPAPGPYATLARTAIVKKYGGFETDFPGIYQLFEDQAFFHKIFLSEKVYISSACNNKYRQRKGSCVDTVHAGGNYYISRKYFLDWLVNYAAKKRIEDSSVNELINKSYSLLERKKQPLVTIITPFFNEARYLKNTIGSVIEQTYDNWEYFLVDDGSSDGSTSIAKEYAALYPGKVFYYDHPSHTNNGVCASRNLGIQNARGDYIAFLDGDDLWLSGKLEQQVEIAIKYPAVNMFCEASHYRGKGSNPKNENVIVPVGAPAEQIYNPPSLIFHLYPLSNGDAPCINSLMFDTEFIRSIGGFDESFKGGNFLYEDQALLFKAYFHGVVYVSSLCNNVYLQRLDSSMHSSLAGGDYRKGRRYFLEWLKGYLKEQDVQYPAIWALYKKCWLSLVYPRVYKYTYGMYFKFKKTVS